MSSSRRILSWKEPDGSTGSILTSRRETYWKQNGNGDAHLRELLKLDKKFDGR
ncbi:MAG: hypothetical protein GF418_16275 [Chitinivibrionales bacterium]|nr:hypothetical protein [Chitinivibrionales bacterium]MBD3397178.1 hypothetical protein [Chitinivibrionales bacterium]